MINLLPGAHERWPLGRMTRRAGQPLNCQLLPNCNHLSRSARGVEFIAGTYLPSDPSVCSNSICRLAWDHGYDCSYSYGSSYCCHFGYYHDYDYGHLFNLCIGVIFDPCSFSPSDLCELLDLVKNDVSSWTCEDVNSDVQLQPIYEHMRSMCNAMWATLTNSLGEDNTIDTESSGDCSVNEVRRIISIALYQLSD
jgi:hypothetical protein